MYSLFPMFPRYKSCRILRRIAYFKDVENFEASGLKITTVRAEVKPVISLDHSQPFDEQFLCLRVCPTMMNSSWYLRLHDINPPRWRTDREYSETILFESRLWSQSVRHRGGFMSCDLKYQDEFIIVGQTLKHRTSSKGWEWMTGLILVLDVVIFNPEAQNYARRKLCAPLGNKGTRERVQTRGTRIVCRPSSSVIYSLSDR